MAIGLMVMACSAPSVLMKAERISKIDMSERPSTLKKPLPRRSFLEGSVLKFLEASAKTY